MRCCYDLIVMFLQVAPLNVATLNLHFLLVNSNEDFLRLEKNLLVHEKPLYYRSACIT